MQGYAAAEPRRSLPATLRLWHQPFTPRCRHGQRFPPSWAPADGVTAENNGKSKRKQRGGGGGGVNLADKCSKSEAVTFEQKQQMTAINYRMFYSRHSHAHKR